MRREWIEIAMLCGIPDCCESPSMRREWIEMRTGYIGHTYYGRSPSMRREWIEMHLGKRSVLRLRSPSMRREWIEMFTPSPGKSIAASLPPCGGSGLKSSAFSVYP